MMSCEERDDFWAVWLLSRSAFTEYLLCSRLRGLTFDPYLFTSHFPFFLERRPGDADPAALLQPVSGASAADPELRRAHTRLAVLASAASAGLPSPRVLNVWAAWP